MALVAPEIFAPPFCHCRVGAGEPDAATVNVMVAPVSADWLAGGVVIPGAVAVGPPVTLTTKL